MFKENPKIRDGMAKNALNSKENKNNVNIVKTNRYFTYKPIRYNFFSLCSNYKHHKILMMFFFFKKLMKTYISYKIKILSNT